jgi:sulfur transfer protein SufE
MHKQLSIPETEKEIVEEFALFDSWDDKYEYIIDLGKKLEPLEDQYKKDENKVRGCQSTVWLVADSRDGKLFFKAESDAIIVKGLISMLIRVLSARRDHWGPASFYSTDWHDYTSCPDPVEWIVVDGKTDEKFCPGLQN